jgi:2-hydroxymuconate-semialdehyde hydrolase
MEAGAEIGRFIDAGGTKTNYHDHGSGPPVILLHGSGPGVTAWANWRFTIQHLSVRFRTIAPDVIGFGYTETNGSVKFDMDRWVQHILSFMDALEIDNAHFIGNSFGGGVALKLANRYPQRVNRLILMGSAGINFELTDGLDYVWGYTPSLERMQKMMEYFAFNRSLISPELVKSRYEASLRPGVQENYANLFPTPRQQWIEHLSMQDGDLRALKNHTLIVHGREDQVVPHACSLRIHELVPASQLHIFGNCGHWTQIEMKDQFNALAASFLS